MQNTRGNTAQNNKHLDFTELFIEWCRNLRTILLNFKVELLYNFWKSLAYL